MPVLFRRGTVTVDDTDPRYQYQGAWHEVTGSSRQWDAGVMATQQPGASVSFSFFGSNAILYQTIPSGSGTVVVDISVDGGDSATVTSACGGANPVYHNIFFSTQIMADITHTVVVTNKSPEEIPFQFDRADIQSHDAPSILPLQDANNVPPPVVVASQIPTSTPKEAPPTTPSSTTTATSIAAAPLGASLTGTFVGSHGVQITQTQISDFSPPKGTASISESETTSSNAGSALPDNASSASPPQVSALITVTTDGHGETLTHTVGTPPSDVPSPSGTSTAGSSITPRARTASLSTSTVLSIVLGVVAFILGLVALIYFLRRKRRSRRKAAGSSSHTTNVIPQPYRSSPSAVAFTDEYPVGRAAIYRDEKRIYDADDPNNLLGTSNGSFSSIDVTSATRNLEIIRYTHQQSVGGSEADDESTVVEAAPPAYHFNGSTSDVASEGTSFYV